ncbi:MAG: VCBS repeat-containing protein [Deltaproteobacteria bacterium]|nr:VCBS repeat-containing protein [Deltaproteobacteria bacterium]
MGPLSVLGDLDQDGLLDIVTGRTAYDFVGGVMWDDAVTDRAGAPTDGFVALGNFDADPNPEVVVVADAQLFLLEHDGTLKWGPELLPAGAGQTARRGGPPTVADFDGDGQPEIGLATNGAYAVYDTGGELLWSRDTQDLSSAATGSSVFDFEGDGWAEVVYNDEVYLRVFDGETGSVLYEQPNTTATAYEYPVIADVDGDGAAEIVVSANPYGSNPTTGIQVFGGGLDGTGQPVWVDTRPIWNQHGYHISNVHDDGTLPMVEADAWDPGTIDGWAFGSGGGTYRANASPPIVGFFEPAADLAVTSAMIDRSSCDTELTLRFWVDNVGATTAPAGITADVYRGRYVAAPDFLGSATTTVALAPGEGELLSVRITSPGARDDVLIVVDDADAISECGGPANGNLIVGAVGCP